MEFYLPFERWKRSRKNEMKNTFYFRWYKQQYAMDHVPSLISSISVLISLRFNSLTLHIVFISNTHCALNVNLFDRCTGKRHTFSIFFSHHLLGSHELKTGNDIRLYFAVLYQKFIGKLRSYHSFKRKCAFVVTYASFHQN